MKNINLQQIIRYHPLDGMLVNKINNKIAFPYFGNNRNFYEHKACKYYLVKNLLIDFFDLEATNFVIFKKSNIPYSLILL